MDGRFAEPFAFAGPVAGEHFAGRGAEAARLSESMRRGVSTILIAPRGLGKTSLVKKAAGLAEQGPVRAALMDAFACRTPGDFAAAFATAVVKAAAPRPEERLPLARKYLAGMAPCITGGCGDAFSVSFSAEAVRTSLEGILALPEAVAAGQGLRLAVCIDEFQLLASFEGAGGFLKRLRAAWQRQERTAYCLCGSRRTLLEQMFESRSAPFHRFGDILHLGKISREDWVDYICRRFAATGKSISPERAGRIADAARRHSAYVQQLAWLAWLKTGAGREAGDADVERALEQLAEHCEPAFKALLQGLPARQFCLLRALCDGVAEGLSSSGARNRYALGTSSSLARARQGLLAKDILVIEGGRPVIADPILELWFRRRAPRR
ncbi:MAG: ATP-binding protein [Duodenibacillus sp.]|nr:ATP-binding protein [Duodenibacillus sp.]